MPLSRGQTPTPTPTREEQIEAARDAKEKAVASSDTRRFEQKLLDLENNRWVQLVNGAEGFHVRVGGMRGVGSGFSLGPAYQRSDLWGERLTFSTSARASLHHWYQGDMQLAMPKLWQERASVELNLQYSNLGGLGYYGQGPDSRKEDRTSYGFEEARVDFRPALHVTRRLSAGGVGGFRAINVGAARSGSYPSSEQLFNATTAPGLFQQGDLWTAGGFAKYDNRDSAGHPTSGGQYRVQYTRSSDGDSRRYGFDQTDLLVQHFIPFFNHKRVIALQGVSTLTSAHSDQVVPFYLQPTVGGPNYLRGFQAYRFTGNNIVAFNAEYRWEAASFLEMALFADAGKVFQRQSQWNIHGMERSYGFGFRFKMQNTPIFRIDTGFSREGFQIWLRSGSSF
ncbi:MAG: hypothetical protein GC160_19645 [Acidobacteria bacterium]|nr:hypothetical protein [Acidobacteriota bacterium]